MFNVPSFFGFKGGSQTPFQFTVDTTIAGSSGVGNFALPLTTSTGLDCFVYWGDGSYDNITSHTAPEVTHTYPSGGTYTIKITGDLLGWQFNNGGDKLKMGEIQKWGALNISVDLGFRGCSNMTCTATDAPTITSTSLEKYFLGCVNFNGSIGNWDLSNVDNIRGIFRDASAFNQDISNWDVNNINNMINVFQNATSFNQPLNTWNTSSTTNFGQMFQGATAFDQDISNWDINQANSFLNFMASVTLSTSNYDALLVGWEANLQSAYPGGVGYPYTLNINFGGSQYTLGGAAATARTSLINNFSWTITDGGGV